MILDLFAYSVGTLITIPIIATFIVYFVSKKIYRHNWKALHTAVNWTTLFYIIAVMTMLKVIFGNTYPGIVLALLLTLFTIVVIVHWKVYTEILFGKVFKVFWRACFLLFVFLYVLLILIGIIRMMI